MLDAAVIVAALSLLAANATGIWVVALRLGCLKAVLEAHDARLTGVENGLSAQLTRLERVR